MKLSKLIEDLQATAKVNGTYDPEVRIIGNEMTMGVDFVGTNGDFAVIHADSFLLPRPCQECRLPHDMCWCDK